MIKKKSRNLMAAAMVLFCIIAAAFSLYLGNLRYLTLRDAGTGELIAKYRVHEGEAFSIGFIHSVNKSPLTDYYVIEEDGIYVEKTVYYGFGAGVESELLPGEKLEYGPDNSMIVSGFHKKIEPLTYFVGTVSDHTLTIGASAEGISLRDLCGRNRRVTFGLEGIMAVRLPFGKSKQTV